MPTRQHSSGSETPAMNTRTAKVKRETRETSISVELNVDGKGDSDIATGIRMLDHLLAQLSHHGALNLKVSATGPDTHHVVEDIALCLGRALNQAMGDRQGIVRMAHAVVPMDDALALVAVDLSGRGYSVIDIPFEDKQIADLPSGLVRHFLETFASEARLNLHTAVYRGNNDHHKAEATFKALARALDAASRIDDRMKDRIPSTKDLID
jgi:imidazoleglycerol-phosphate dehydratase